MQANQSQPNAARGTVQMPLEVRLDIARMNGLPTVELARRKPALQICKFCGDWVNLDEEGNTYANGTAAHEDCHDSNEFNRANASDFRD